MAIECGSCPKTFRTENGKRWHLDNRHGQVRTSEPNGQVQTSELELIVENEISSQVLDRNSPLNLALDERIVGVLAEVKVMIGDSDSFLREHIEHRIDERLQAVTAIRREPAKVEMESNALDKYLRDDKPARSDPLATYLADDKPASSDPLAPWLRQREVTKDPLVPYRRRWPAVTPVKVVDTSCPLSATGKRCDHLEPARQHAALRGIGFPETPIREQATPAKVVEMEGYFPGPLTGCLSHPHVQSRELESSNARTWPSSKESLDHAIRDALEYLGIAG